MFEQTRSVGSVQNRQENPCFRKGTKITVKKF